MRLEDHIRDIPDFPRPGIASLTFLGGRERLRGYDVNSLVTRDAA